MYQNPVVQRPPPEEEDRLRREPRLDTSVPGPPGQYSHPSPHAVGQPYHNYSPTHASLQQPGYNAGYSSRPPSSSAAHPMQPSLSQGPVLRPETSPRGVASVPYAPRDTTRSTYYDPTSEHREGGSSWNRHSPYSGRSPIQNSESAVPYADNRMDNSIASQSAHRSPTQARFPPPRSPTFPNLHTHPTNHHSTSTYPKSPSPRSQHTHSSISHIVNGASSGIPESDHRAAEAPPPIKVEQPKRADPMSFSNILSSNTADDIKPPPAPLDPATKDTRRTSKLLNGDATTSKPPTPSSTMAPRKTQKQSPPKEEKPAKSTRPRANKQPAVKKQTAPTSKEEEKIQEAMRKIDAMAHSDIESADFGDAKENYVQAGHKRARKIEDDEAKRRKRARIEGTKTLIAGTERVINDGKSHFRHRQEQDVVAEVHAQEVQDEKERKKDMQRKRRREKTVQNEKAKREGLMKQANEAEDEAERVKLMKEAEKAEKKARTTQNTLDNIGGEIENVNSLKRSLNAEGGTMSTFSAADGASPEPPKKKPRTGMTTRPKKSKEKKQAEKDRAEDAYNEMQKDEPVSIAPKDEAGRRESLREPKEGKPKRRGGKAAAAAAAAAAAEATPPPTTTYESKGYIQIYEQIWRDISRKDAPKTYRLKEQALAQKQSNLRKTAQLASKEARRWTLRTNKSTKDVQARAKRSMREMMSFWKRNEREERDLRRVAERQELELARKAEADREANRQKRKLDFLLKQTELYSHFIGKKAKTDEIERSTDQADPNAPQADPATTGTASSNIKLPDGSKAMPSEKVDISNLDFDAADDDALNDAAMANAQIAITKAQNEAKNFNKQRAQSDEAEGSGEEKMAQFDEGELNFQDPTSFGDVDVKQPRMLTCQLKEYQLKGLNWLVNLYEQGINGILADEMGLGKTIQSISVMAYLAERHNIWGPYLVVCPTSTLHNWIQEINKFVPRLKAAPYWGTANERKILRKDWDRKAITYEESHKAHVFITSYQLVIQDQSYLTKMNWQYMILDEAQAIKSSQSSRWKTLMNFHCRNRLLLTGTPIQNNMQELWALLHFIMPSLFDSHDEFSEWFSKDIESHAQSNTKLNESQLKRLHMILKPFMLRRVKKHVQKELGDKVETDVECQLTYRQRALYAKLRDRINFMELVDTATDKKDDVTNLMNLVMQFRKVCNHPHLFSSAEICSPVSLSTFAPCASFAREGNNVTLAYSTRALVQYELPRLLCAPAGRLHVPGPTNPRVGFETKYLKHLMNIWTPEHIRERSADDGAFSWLRFADTSVGEACEAAQSDLITRTLKLHQQKCKLGRMKAVYDDEEENAGFTPASALFKIVERNDRQPLADISSDGRMANLLNVSRTSWEASNLRSAERCYWPSGSAPPIEIDCSNQDAAAETQRTFFNTTIRRALYPLTLMDEQALLDAKVEPSFYPPQNMLPPPISDQKRYTNIQVPSMRRFVSDCGKLARLDALLTELKAGGHKVLIYFQMTKMMDLMEEYLTYRNLKFLRLDGSTKLGDRRDRVSNFQTNEEIFIFLLSTRAGGLGINLTAADTVIFYDSDWNPTIDSQAMDRAHRLGQTRQVTVYRMITQGTVEERIRKRALQKEEVQRVVIQGGAPGGASAMVDFNTRPKEKTAMDIAMWLADDEQAEILEQKEREAAARGASGGSGDADDGQPAKKKRKTGGRKKEINMDDMYHEGEGHFDDINKPSGTATPANGAESDATPARGRGPRGGKGLSKKAKTAKQRLAIADGNA